MTLTDAAKIIGQALQHIVPEGFVIVFAILPDKPNKGSRDVIVGSVPPLENQNQIANVLQAAGELAAIEGEAEDIPENSIH